MKDVSAREIMVPLERYPHIPYWFTLRHAIAEINKTQIEVAGRRSLPRRILVFDEAYNLLGVARRRDILRGLEPEFAKGAASEYRKKLFDVEFDPNLLEVTVDRWTANLEERAEHQISEVMQPIKVTVDYDDHILKIMHEMVAHDTSMIPVVKDGSIAGVVRTVDVFHHVAKLLL